MVDPQHAEIVALVRGIRTALDDLAIRGLRAAGPDDLTQLEAYRDQLRGMGAGHLAEHLDTLLDETREDQRAAARSLVRAQAGLRVFQRLLTLRSVASRLTTPVEG